MDSRSFDRLARVLSGTANRRDGLRAAVAAAFGVASVGATAEESRADGGRGPQIEGPCGNGSRKANTCRKNRQCCTGYCKKGRKNKGGKGRCRCIKPGKQCKPSQTCCAGTCIDGACFSTVPTGQACIPATDICANAAATCQAYDSGDPAGTYCILPTGAACDSDGECFSQDCSGGTCAAVACTVCESGCPFSDLASAIASPPADGRIKIAPGTWTNTAASFDITQSMQIEACGGAPGVILLPIDFYVFNVAGEVTLTVQNIEFGYEYQSAALSAAGTSAQAMATLNVTGCTFQGGSEYISLSPSNYFTVTVTDCTFNSAPVSSVSATAGDPSSMTFENCTFTGEVESPVIEIGGNLDVSFTGCTISGGGYGGIAYTTSATEGTATVSLADTVVSGNTSPLTGGGGILAIAEDGASVTVVLGDGVSVTGNSAPAGRGSGILAWGMNGSVVTITGAPGKVSGNTPNPQCAITTNGSTWTAVPNCAY